MTDDPHACVFTGRKPGCSSGTMEDGQLKPARTEKPRTLCPTCFRGVERAVTETPEMFVALHAAIGDRSKRPGQRVSGTKVPPIPLNVDVDAAMNGLVDWTSLAVLRIWDQVGSRDKTGELNDPPEPLSRITAEHARIVSECCHKLAPNIERLIDVGEETAQIWRKTGESTTFRDMSGTDIAAEIVKAHKLARRILGHTSPRQHLVLGCPQCASPTLYRRITRTDTGVRDDVTCDTCGAGWDYDRYRQLAHIVADEEEKRKVTEQEKLEAWLAAEQLWFQLVETRKRLARFERGFAAALDPMFATLPAKEFAETVLRSESAA